MIQFPVGFTWTTREYNCVIIKKYIKDGFLSQDNYHKVPYRYMSHTVEQTEIGYRGHTFVREMSTKKILKWLKQLGLDDTIHINHFDEDLFEL